MSRSNAGYEPPHARATTVNGRICKGILLAGGSGSRLGPMTRVISKQLLPVYDKPLVYYPLSTLLLAGIREILLICAPGQVAMFQRLLGDGGRLGVSLRYAVQPQPRGIAEALIIARDFVGNDSVALVLGDNIFYGHGLPQKLHRAATRSKGATVFTYAVKEPSRYGVVELDEMGLPLTLEEKPVEPRSHEAVTGLYFYDNQAIDMATTLRPSERNELEITDVNRAYLELGQLHVERLGRGYAWLDAGTPEALLQAANFVSTLEQRQGLKVACIEEVAYRMELITATQLERLADEHAGEYGTYLRGILARPTAMVA